MTNPVRQPIREASGPPRPLPSLLPRRALLLLLLALLALPFAAGCKSMVGRYQRWQAKREANRPPFHAVIPAVADAIMRDAATVLVLDLRSAREFNSDTGHLYHAINIPLDRLPYRLIEIRSYRDQTFLVYCRDTSCGTAGMSVLTSSGFEDAILVRGGIERWIHDGFRTYLPATASGRVEKRNDLLLGREFRSDTELPVLRPLPPSQIPPPPQPPAKPAAAPPEEEPPARPPPAPAAASGAPGATAVH